MRNSTSGLRHDLSRRSDEVKTTVLMRPHEKTYVGKLLVGKTKLKWACAQKEKCVHVLRSASDGMDYFCVGFREVKVSSKLKCAPYCLMIALLSSECSVVSPPPLPLFHRVLEIALSPLFS